MNKTSKSINHKREKKRTTRYINQPKREDPSESKKVANMVVEIRKQKKEKKGCIKLRSG